LIKKIKEMNDRTSLRGLRIAYLTARDPDDRKSWSGTLYYMARAMEKHCGEVFRVGPLLQRAPRLGRLLARGVRVLTGRTYLDSHTTALSKKLGRIASQRISREHCNVIFAPAGSTTIAHLETDLPIVYSSDATVQLMLGYYDEFRNVLPSHVRMANQLERTSIGKASRLVYPSSWAAESAIGDYGADGRKLTVVPFGANLENPPAREAVLRTVGTGTCHLLFVGVSWERKGGEIAVETVVELERLGVTAELTVVGCQPPQAIRHPRIHFIPFIDKNTPEGRARLDHLYKEADFFLLPTRAECYGVAFCEANAYGLPVFATHTGGVPEIVHEGVNGYLFPLAARGSEYARRIRDVFNHRETSQALRVSSRKEFETRLNWDHWGENLFQVLQAAVRDSQRTQRMN
jgi:glycosyltransferase involved in cell wall biosynthesis